MVSSLSSAHHAPLPIYRASVAATGTARFSYRARRQEWLNALEARRLLQHPIIIGGCGRSGTTLLAGLLDVHPSIQTIPAETNGFSPGAYGKSAHGRPPHLNTIYRHVTKMIIAPTTSRICEKTPKNVHYYEPILRYFGDRVRIINIVRDGRDVTLSIHPGKDEPWVSPHRWVSDVRAGLRFDQHPQVHTLTYEALVTNTNDSLQAICRFLDEPWDPTIVERYEDGPALGRLEAQAFFATGKGKNRRRAPNTNSVGKWRNVDPERIAPLINEPGAIDLLRHYDYLDEHDGCGEITPSP